VDEDKIRQLLHALKDEPVPPDSLVRVRTQIAKRTQRAFWTRLGGPWVWSAALTPLFILLLTVGFITYKLQQPIAAIESHNRVAGVPQVPIPATATFEAQSVKVRHRPALNQKTPESDISIRIETEDPNVVILLIGD
jgi:anti-sigma factor RsiW